MDYIRSLLLEMEADTSGTPFLGQDDPVLNYHLSLMVEAGLINGTVILAAGGEVGYVAVQGISWKGHDFLDASRDSRIWRMAKEKVLVPGASWTFGVLLEYLKAEAKRALGIP